LARTKGLIFSMRISTAPDESNFGQTSYTPPRRDGDSKSGGGATSAPEIQAQRSACWAFHAAQIVERGHDADDRAEQADERGSVLFRSPPSALTAVQMRDVGPRPYVAC